MKLLRTLGVLAVVATALFFLKSYSPSVLTWLGNILGALVALWIVAMAIVIVVFNVKRVRAMRVARSVSASTSRKALTLIDAAGSEDGHRVLLLRQTSEPNANVRHLGSVGAMPEGTTILGEMAVGSRVLAQVRLVSPPLSRAWEDRVAVLFQTTAGEVRACSIRVALHPALDERLSASTPPSRLEGVFLPPGDRIDNEPDDDLPSPPYASGSLLRRVPQLRTLLASYPDRAERLLPHILVPGIGTHEIETFHVTLMGGDPELIQSDHEATCRRCAKPAEFLLQFGAILDLAGDAPVAYVYGCREHPEDLLTFIDTH